MDPAAQTRGPWRLPRPPIWALGALFPLALAPFATVHAGPRTVMGLLAALLGTWALVHGVRQRRPSREVGWLALGGVAATLLSGLSFISVGPEARQALQPAFAAVVLESLSVAGAERAPLALDPHHGLMTWGVSAQLLLLALGTALALRSSGRAARLAGVLLGAGCALVAIAAAHRLTGAESIWWVSQVPSFSRAPFFGPFVNPNHGGVTCAALLPIAAALAISRRSSNQLAGGVALLVLLVGLRLSGSRGALLAGAAGLLSFLALIGGRRVQLGLGAVAALAGVGVGVVGLDVVGEALSAWLVPEALGPGEDLYTGRGEVWADVLRMIEGAPLLGVGPAGFDDGFQLVKTSPTFSRLDHAHQELLQLAAEGGVVVLGIWVMLLARVAWVAARRCLDPEQSRPRRRLIAGYLGAAVAMGVACLYTFPLRIGALQLLAALLVGALVGLSSGQDGRRSLPARAVTLLALTLLLLSLGAEALAWGTRDSERSRWGDADAAMQRGELARTSEAPDAFDAAMGWYKLALLRQPLRREPLQLMSRLERYHGGSFQGAVAALEVATHVYPTLPWPHRDLARLRAAAMDEVEARAAWRAALACDLPEGMEEELVAEALKGSADPALLLAEAIPPRADRLAAAGHVLEKRGAHAVAEQAFREAAALDPHYGAHLGAALLRRGQADAALEVARQVEPPSCFSLRVRAEALGELGQREEALEETRQAMKACGAKHDRELRLLSAGIRLSDGDARALEVYEALLKEVPGDHPVRRLLVAELRARRWEEQLARQLRVLVDAGAATPAEEKELAGLAARGISGH
ncbi:MAG: O-antigen ligase family protein [Deltaproteobacteria bacterium]|nr:O-antigen ligase family protein [Deltaproteobacteria bacterium]